jgi:transcriptional regulator with XRE-family HTH domain
MIRDKRNDSMPSRPVSLFRGLYSRVARKLGVDPSYVSRVARGERESEIVLSALTEEVKKVLAELQHMKQRTGKAPEKLSTSPERPPDSSAREVHNGNRKPRRRGRLPRGKTH